MSKPLPIKPGDKFNRLTVKAFAGKSKRRNFLWECECECGVLTTVVASYLTSGHIRSCGCLQREMTSKARKTHGRSRTRIYNIWCGMRSRCYNPKSSIYRHYGGRGIKVCKRWRHSFENFFVDMGQPTSSKHSLERKKNNGNYSLSNCVWATRKTQNRNTRRNLMITHDGRTQCVSAWCEELGLKRATIDGRRERGWPESRWLETPAPRYRRREDKQQNDVADLSLDYLTAV